MAHDLNLCLDNMNFDGTEACSHQPHDVSESCTDQSLILRNNEFYPFNTPEDGIPLVVQSETNLTEGSLESDVLNYISTNHGVSSSLHFYIM
jgi:hypothetical protein